MGADLGRGAGRMEQTWGGSGVMEQTWGGQLGSWSRPRAGSWGHGADLGRAAGGMGQT